MIRSSASTSACRAGEVVGGQQPQGDHLDAGLAAPGEQFEDVIGALLMAGTHVGQARGPRPPPVAIQDHPDVPRDRVPRERCLQPPLVQPVDEIAKSHPHLLSADALLTPERPDAAPGDNPVSAVASVGGEASGAAVPSPLSTLSRMSPPGRDRDSWRPGTAGPAQRADRHFHRATPEPCHAHRTRARSSKAPARRAVKPGRPRPRRRREPDAGAAAPAGPGRPRRAGPGRAGQPIDLTMASSRLVNEDRYSRRSRFIRVTIASYSSIRSCR